MRRIFEVRALATHFDVGIAATLVTEYAYCKLKKDSGADHGGTAGAYAGDGGYDEMTSILVCIENRSRILS